MKVILKDASRAYTNLECPKGLEVLFTWRHKRPINADKVLFEIRIGGQLVATLDTPGLAEDFFSQFVDADEPVSGRAKVAFTEGFPALLAARIDAHPKNVEIITNLKAKKENVNIRQSPIQNWSREPYYRTPTKGYFSKAARKAWGDTYIINTLYIVYERSVNWWQWMRWQLTGQQQGITHDDNNDEALTDMLEQFNLSSIKIAARTYFSREVSMSTLKKKTEKNIRWYGKLVKILKNHLTKRLRTPSQRTIKRKLERQKRKKWQMREDSLLVTKNDARLRDEIMATVMIGLYLSLLLVSSMPPALIKKGVKVATIVKNKIRTLKQAFSSPSLNYSTSLKKFSKRRKVQSVHSMNTQ